jgi:hypothetical protein
MYEVLSIQKIGVQTPLFGISDIVFSVTTPHIRHNVATTQWQHHPYMQRVLDLDTQAFIYHLDDF